MKKKAKRKFVPQLLQERPTRPPDVLTHTGLDPDDVSPDRYGEHRSEVRRPGVRSWWFESHAGAVLFKHVFPTRLIKERSR